MTNNNIRYPIYNKRERFISRLKQFVIFSLIIVAGAIFFLYVYGLLPPDQQNWYAALSLAYFLPPAGKETVIIIGLNQNIPLVLWCLTLWVFDVLVCIAIMTNWWLLEALIAHIPPFSFIGLRRKKPRIYITRVSLKHWYEKLQKKTSEIEQRRYGRFLLFVLMLFMFIPFQGTGSLSTTVIGTTLGLRKRTILFIVVFGSMFSILLISSLYIGIITI